MLRKLSLALAVSCASNGMAWAAKRPCRQEPIWSASTRKRSTTTPTWPPPAQYGAQKEVVPQARAGLLPNLSGGAEVSNARTSIDSRRHRQPQCAFLPGDPGQPLFRADRWFQLQAAKDVNEQAALQLSATEQNLILQTAESYFNVLRSQDNLASTKAEEAAFKRQLDQSNERFDVGLSDKTDVLQSQASYDTARPTGSSRSARWTMPSKR
jgi:outer membrane protein